jgi:hypothetical protein
VNRSFGNGSKQGVLENGWQSMPPPAAAAGPALNASAVATPVTVVASAPARQILLARPRSTLTRRPPCLGEGSS